MANVTIRELSIANKNRARIECVVKNNFSQTRVFGSKRNFVDMNKETAIINPK